MKIQITTLNVGDADAIIVHLSRSAKDQLVILIDGGHTNDGYDCIEKLKPILEKAGKDGPDLVVCTHYDADHVLGLIKVVQVYGEEIKEVWMHRPGGPAALMNVAHIKLNEMLAEEIHPIGTFQEFPNERMLKAEKMVLESYDQMRKLEAAISEFPNIKLIGPFPETTYNDWPEIKILGPTLKFYEESIARIDDVPKVLAEEAAQLLNETVNHILMYEESVRVDRPPCEQLNIKKKSPVSLVNQISVIMEITVEGDKYLFTGDASLESFEALPDYPGCISGIYWLKVPHHGSHNNSSPELFSHMNPQFADISGGTRYLNDLVRDCLIQKNVAVRTTRDSGTDLIFPYPSQS